MQGKDRLVKNVHVGVYPIFLSLFIVFNTGNQNKQQLLLGCDITNKVYGNGDF